MDALSPQATQLMQSVSRSDLLLQESLVLLKPLIALLVANGVTHPQLSAALKQTFVDAAQDELTATGKKQTDSAISILSGVHRKDVRAFNQATRDASNKKSGSVAAEVFTRWCHDPAFCDESGKPLCLARTGPHPSFETLAAAVSRDIHPRTMLEEMLRLGVASLTDNLVQICAEAFVPQADFAEMANFFALNLRDHLAAGAANLRANLVQQRPPYLEQSVFADELSAESIAMLADKTQTIWSDAFKAIVSTATERCAVDAKSGEQQQRMRFGIYFYSEPTDSQPTIPESN